MPNKVQGQQVESLSNKEWAGAWELLPTNTDERAGWDGGGPEPVSCSGAHERAGWDGIGPEPVSHSHPHNTNTAGTAELDDHQVTVAAGYQTIGVLECQGNGSSLLAAAAARNESSGIIGC